MKHFAGIMALAMGAAAAGYFLFVENPGVLSKWPAAEGEITVRVVPVRRGSVPATITLAGELSSAKAANIVSRLAGKVTEVRFKVGDAVPAGAVVARIHAGALAARASEFEAALDAARQDLKSRQELVSRADHQLAQTREWHRQDLIARRELEQAETAAETARAQAELARANMEQQAAMLDQVRSLEKLTRLSAPFSGVVTHRWAEPGASIVEFAPVLTIADPRKLKMVTNYFGPHADDIGVGRRLEITSLERPGKIFSGKVARVESAPDGAKQVCQIEIEVENSGESLRPGTAAQAVIALEKHEDVLLVPKRAVVLRDGKNYVYKVADGRAVRQEVALGAIHGEEIAIRGVAARESVIIENQDFLKPNSAVRPLPAPASAAVEMR
jgi:RND family efflux transporter MFP subunit